MKCVIYRKIKISIAKQNSHLTQHKRFVSYGTHPNSAFGGTSFMLGTLGEMVEIQTHHI